MNTDGNYIFHIQNSLFPFPFAFPLIAKLFPFLLGFTPLVRTVRISIKRHVSKTVYLHYQPAQKAAGTEYQQKSTVVVVCK